MGGGPKSFLKLMHVLGVLWNIVYFMWVPPQNFSVVITVACKYLLFITVCLENGIKKKHYFPSDCHMIWIFHCSSTKSQIGILGMNQVVETLRSSHVLGRLCDGDESDTELNRIWSHCRVISRPEGK